MRFSCMPTQQSYVIVNKHLTCLCSEKSWRAVCLDESYTEHTTDGAVLVYSHDVTTFLKLLHSSYFWGNDQGIQSVLQCDVWMSTPEHLGERALVWAQNICWHAEIKAGYIVFKFAEKKLRKIMIFMVSVVIRLSANYRAADGLLILYITDIFLWLQWVNV